MAKRIYDKNGLSNKKGIYKIVNNVNGKFYIGSSINLAKRKWEHFKQLRLDIHCNSYLRASYNKYGKDAFSFEIVEILPDDYTEEQVLLEEQKYIDLYWDGGKTCYNISKIADKPDSEQNKIPVNQIDKKTGEIIKTWAGIVVAGMELNIDPTMIMNACRGRLCTAKGFCWKYVDDELAAQFPEKRSPHGGRGKKVVYKIDPFSKKVMKQYNSIEEAAIDNNCKRVGISNSCNGKRRYCKGFIYSFDAPSNINHNQSNPFSSKPSILPNESEHNNTMKCLICNINNFSSLKALATHIQFAHKMNSEQYTLQYLYNSKRPLCEAENCKEHTRYVSFAFKKYCKKHLSLAFKEGGRVGGRMGLNNDFQKFLNTLSPQILDNTLIEFIELNKIVEHEHSKTHSTRMYDAFTKNKKYMMFYSDEWENKQELVKSMICYRLNAGIKKHDARKLELIQLENKEGRKFFDKNHIAGSVPSKIFFGLKDNKTNEVLCAISLRKPQRKKHVNTVEISRFASKIGYNVRGGFTKLLGKCKTWAKEGDYQSLLSYAELRFGTGDVYMNNGFDLVVKNTGENYWYTDHKRRWFRFKFRAQPGKPENQVAAENGVFRVYGCGNMLYKMDL